MMSDRSQQARDRHGMDARMPSAGRTGAIACGAIADGARSSTGSVEMLRRRAEHASHAVARAWHERAKASEQLAIASHERAMAARERVLASYERLAMARAAVV